MWSLIFIMSDNSSVFLNSLQLSQYLDFLPTYQSTCNAHSGTAEVERQPSTLATFHHATTFLFNYHSILASKPPKTRPAVALNESLQSLDVEDLINLF